MNPYKIQFQFWHFEDIEVEADNLKQAIELAQEQINEKFPDYKGNITIDRDDLIETYNEPSK